MVVSDIELKERNDLIESVYNKFQKPAKPEYIKEDLTETMKVSDQKTFRDAIGWIKRLKDCPKNISYAIDEYIKMLRMKQHEKNKTAELVMGSGSHARFNVLISATLGWAGWEKIQMSYSEFWKEVMGNWLRCRDEDAREKCMTWAEERYRQIISGEIKTKGVGGQ